MSGIEHCQVLGPFNSGTVLMQSYVNHLFRNVRHDGFAYWKHSLPPRYQRNSDQRILMQDAVGEFPGVLLICMVRSPYFWLPATCRRHYNFRFTTQSFDLGQRLRSPVYLKGELFINLARAWNGYYRGYAHYLEPMGRVIYVRLEDLVRNPAATIQRLETRLERRPESDVAAVVAKLSRRPSKSDNAFGSAWEEKNRLEHVTRTLRRQDLSFINQQIDPELLKRFDYPLAWPAPECARPGLGASAAAR
ncbi:hypothetical protein [Elongatibacter sediminis]|uniref:Sulfotransferase domain-containing protein n=1 Tax=Elongatibacter sediminis TaxID=3119006 RepID=A0AAW9R6I9_9GAMM